MEGEQLLPVVHMRHATNHTTASRILASHAAAKHATVPPYCLQEAEAEPEVPTVPKLTEDELLAQLAMQLEEQLAGMSTEGELPLSMCTYLCSKPRVRTYTSLPCILHIGS